MICGHGHEQKFRYPYPRDSKKIQMPYPRAKAIDQNSALCPASPPAGLTLIGALWVQCKVYNAFQAIMDMLVTLFQVLYSIQLKVNTYM